MSRWIRLSVIAVLLLTLAVTSAFSVNAGPGANPKGPQKEADIASFTVSEKDAADALAFWTKEARMAAQPMPLPAYTPTEGDVSEALGEPGFAVGAPGDAKAILEAMEQFPEEWADLAESLTAEEADVVDYGTANIYTSYAANRFSNMWKYYPYYTVGRLLISGGGYCSASLISPNNVIVTAGHCVYNRSAGSWYPGWTFIPAYRDGAAPYGTFPATQAWTMTSYISTGARAYDIGVIKLRNNSAGRTATSYVGYMGRSWNYSYTQHMHAAGYPSNLTSGKYTWLCAAESFYGGANVLAMGCNMTFGSSGGPWIRRFTPNISGAVNYVNSVVSGGTPGTPTFYGARFTDGNIVPLCAAAGC